MFRLRVCRKNILHISKVKTPVVFLLAAFLKFRWDPNPSFQNVPSQSESGSSTTLQYIQ